MSERLRTAKPDFLDRMINNALGVNNAIQPRVPGVYEPVTGCGPSVLSSGQANSPSPDDSAMDQAAPRAIRDKPAPQLYDVHDASAAPHIRRDRTAAASASERDQSMATGPEDRTPVRSARRPAAPIAAKREATLRVSMLPSEDGAETAPRRSSALNAQLTQAGGDAPTRIGELLASPRIAPVREMESIPVSEVKGLDGIRSPKEQRQEPRPVNAETVTRGALLPSAISVTQKTAQSRSEVPSLQQRQVSDAEPVPIVNVTISRVEVRAVGSPSAPLRQHREPKGQKPMSLDDYLKQRGDGR